MKFVSNNPNYNIVNNEIDVVIAKRVLDVTINNNVFNYTSKEIALDFCVTDNIPCDVTFTQDNEVTEFRNSGEYLYLISPKDTTHYEITLVYVKY